MSIPEYKFQFVDHQGVFRNIFTLEVVGANAEAEAIREAKIASFMID